MSSLHRRRRWLASALVPLVPLLLVATPLAEPVQAAGGTVDCRANPSALGPALATASPGATVRFSGTCVGTFAIAKDLTLEGSGRAVLDGQGAAIVLGLNFDPQIGPIVLPPPTIRVTGLTVKGGSEAGVVNWAASELENVTVRDNSGDGIFTHAMRLTLERSMVRDNGGDGIQSMAGVGLIKSTVRGNAGHGIWGGAGIDVVASVVELNGGRGLASTDQTGIGVDRSVVRGNRDGGISVGANSALVVTDSSITGNATASDGGGIRAPGALLAGFHIARSVIAGNSAAGDGGGIYTSGASASDVIEGATIRSNTAGGRGGGIFNGIDPFAEAAESVLTVRASRITGNGAGVTGGGIYNQGSVVLDGTRVTGNTPDDCAGC